MWAEAEEELDNLKLPMEIDRVLSMVRPEDEESFQNPNIIVEHDRF